MCYNFETSISSWLMTFIISIATLLNCDNNCKWIIIFVLVYSQVQIMEAIIWRNVKNSHAPTKLLVHLLLLQPIINSLCGWYMVGSKVLLLISIVCVYALFDYYYRHIDHKYECIVGDNKHLVWTMKDAKGEKQPILGKYYVTIYILGLFIPFLFMKSNLKYIPLAFGIISYIYSYTNTQGDEYMSLWCYTATYLVVIMFIYSTFTSG